MRPIFTEFSDPGSLVCDDANNIYVIDNYIGTVLWKIDQQENVTTITNLFSTGSSIAAIDHNGNILGFTVEQVFEMTPATNTLMIAGPSPSHYNDFGYTNGPGNLALFSGITGICLSQGTIFVADSENHRIRSISFNTPSQQLPEPNISIASYAGITITGNVGSAYQIQSSSNMENWTSETTILLPSNPYLWFDTNNMAGNKFYRAYLMP